MRPRTHGRRSRCACGLALAALVGALLAAGVASASGPEPPPDPVPAAVAARIGEALALMRRHVDPAPSPTLDTLRSLSFRGRPSVEVKGRVATGEAPGPVRDFAIWDLGTARIAVFVFFPNASARRQGEAIISMSEISSVADAHVRALLPGAGVALEGIQRHRASGQESVYYEASYAPLAGDVPFLQPPVRLLLDASTGRLFRFDLDPEWLAPPATPAARIARQAAERIATVALASRDLSGTLGADARPGKVFAGELFYVRPNAWLGFHDPAAAPATRVAWVVPFTLAGDASGTRHALFVDAASGHVLGGMRGDGGLR